MITKVMVGISALISLVYVVADEIAVNYMLTAANGAALAATDRPSVDLIVLRRQAQSAVKDLQDLQQLAKAPDATSQCKDQAWPYYSGACIAAVDERQVRMVNHGAGRLVAAPMQAASF